jgi:hypothetical protein
VDANVLCAHEVLAVGRVLGNLGGDEVAVVVAPCGGSEVAAVADTLFEDLEPVTGTVVGFDAACGRLGHVHETGTWVLELGAYGELKTDFLTRIDGEDLGLAGGGEGALIADDIRAVGGGAITDVGLGVRRKLDGVVLGRAGGLSNVFESWLSSTADNVGVEKVVSGGHLGDSAEGKSRELHSDRAVTNVMLQEAKKRM